MRDSNGRCSDAEQDGGWRWSGEIEGGGGLGEADATATREGEAAEEAEEAAAAPVRKAGKEEVTEDGGRGRG